MGVSSAGVARKAKEGIGGPSSRGLFRKWGAQGKSRLTGPESWTLWCADIRSCMLEGLFCVQCCGVRSVRCRALRAGLRRVAGSRQSTVDWQTPGRGRTQQAAGELAVRRGQRQRSAGQAGAGAGAGAGVVVRGVVRVGRAAVAVAVGRRGFTGADGTFDD